MEKQIPFTGILSNNPEENPGFFSNFMLTCQDKSTDDILHF